MRDLQRAAEAAPAGSEPPRPASPRAPTLEDFEVLADALTPYDLPRPVGQEGNTTVGGGAEDTPPPQCPVQSRKEEACSSEAVSHTRAARSHRAALQWLRLDDWRPLLDLVDRRGL